MCIVAVAWQLFDDLPLVLLSNRDEFFHRPTLPLYHWQNSPILAGQDQLAGGTWLGINTVNGRWAVILNYREVRQKKPVFSTSRGQLVQQFLLSEKQPVDFARNIKLKEYDGFNMIIGNHLQAVMFNNKGFPIQPLANGLYVLSNGQPYDDWFKTERLRGRVRQEILPLIAEKQDWQQASWQVLTDSQLAPDEHLPHTGLSLPAESALSSIFIPPQRNPTIFHQPYGTRCSSIVCLGHDSYYFSETCYDVNSAVTCSTTFKSNPDKALNFTGEDNSRISRTPK